MTNKTFFATINTDASWCPNTKLGAYSYWITSNNGRIRSCGIFKDTCESSNEAEAKAIENALFVMFKKAPICDFYKVIVNTDSQYAINTLSLKYKKIEFRHVKGHTDVDDARSFVNRWCDKAALDQLRQARKGAKSKFNLENINWK